MSIQKSNKPAGKTTAGKRLRNDAQVMADRAKIAGLLLKGTELYEICRQVGIGYSLLRFDIKAIQTVWMESAVRDIDQAAQIAVRKLEKLESVYWDAWERSVKGKTRIHEHKKMTASRGRGKRRKAGGLKIINASTMQEETYGDPRFLMGVRQCVMDIAKIRGVIQEVKGAGDVPQVAAPNQATFIIMPANSPARSAPKDITPQTPAIAAIPAA